MSINTNKKIVNSNRKLLNANRIFELEIQVRHNIFNTDTYRKFNLSSIDPKKYYVKKIYIPAYYFLPEYINWDLFTNIQKLKAFINQEKIKKGENFKGEKEVNKNNPIKENEASIEEINKKTERELEVINHNIRILLSKLFKKGNNYYIQNYNTLYIFKYNLESKLEFDEFKKIKDEKKIIKIRVRLVLSLEKLTIQQQAKLTCYNAKTEIKEDLSKLLELFTSSQKDTKNIPDIQDIQENDDLKKLFLKYPILEWLNKNIFDFDEDSFLDNNNEIVIPDELKELYNIVDKKSSYSLLNTREKEFFSNIYDTNKNKLFFTQSDFKKVKINTIFNTLIMQINRFQYLKTKRPIQKSSIDDYIKEIKINKKKEEKIFPPTLQLKKKTQSKQTTKIFGPTPKLETSEKTKIESDKSTSQYTQPLKTQKVLKSPFSILTKKPQEITYKQDIQLEKTTSENPQQDTQKNEPVTTQLFESPEKKQIKKQETTLSEQSQESQESQKIQETQRDLSKFSLKEGQKIELPSDFKKKIKNKPEEEEEEEEEGWTTHENPSPIKKLVSQQETTKLELPPQSSRRTRKKSPPKWEAVGDFEEEVLEKLPAGMLGGNKKKSRKNKKY